MTPLAHRITKELTLPLDRRKFTDHCGLQSKMDDIHCFDLSEVWPLISQFANDGIDFSETLAFLPAPKTWIEWMAPNGRIGTLLIGNGDTARAFAAFDTGSSFGSSENYEVIPLGDERWLASPIDWEEARLRKEVDISGMLYAALAIINSPRMIGRKQHSPHRGLERRLLNAKHLVGKFPLHAWTELKLSVADIGKKSDGTSHEAHYTGEKCLHFCRSHLRVRNGRLERVSAHWRGNPALGIKRTRYRLTV